MGVFPTSTGSRRHWLNISIWIGGVIEPCEPTGSPEFDKVRAAAWRIQMGQEDNVQLWNDSQSMCFPQSMAALSPPSQPFSTVLPPSPTLFSHHELPCLTRDIANYIHQPHSSEYRSVSAMIPCYFTVPNMSKLSILSHHRPSPAFQAHPCHTWLLLSCFCSSLLFQEPTKELVLNSWAD